MAYKDPDKQREANKQASQRRRDKLKSMTQDNNAVTPKQGGIVILDTAIGQGRQEDSAVTGLGRLPANSPINFGQPDCQCKHCQQNRANNSKHIINHEAPKPDYLLAKDELNRVTLPGDPDYGGVCLDPKYDK